jgi:hypothetical protein
MIWESKKIEREMMEESRKWREEEATKRKAAAAQKEARSYAALRSVRPSVGSQEE